MSQPAAASAPVPSAPPAPRLVSPATFELAARWYVFLFLNIYGWGKIAGGQFYRHGRVPAEVATVTLGQASGFDLAWTFMGYSFAYILFIGLVEVLGAWLLLWEDTKLFGVALLLPVMVNIVVFDIIFLDEYGALASAVIYTLLLFFILVCNRQRVKAAVQALLPGEGKVRLPLGQRARTALVAIGSMALLFAVDQAFVNLFGHGRG